MEHSDDFTGYEHSQQSHLLYDGKRMRKHVTRKTIDFNSSFIKYLHGRVIQRSWKDIIWLKPTMDYIKDLEPSFRTVYNPAAAYCTKFVSVGTNKEKFPINCCAWTPEARWLLTGNAQGMVTIWNGLEFNFITMFAQDHAIRTMQWMHNGKLMITGDDKGGLRIFEPSMNMVAENTTAHSSAVRDISFCPTDLLFVTGSQDHSVRLWNAGIEKISSLGETGKDAHGMVVTSVHWHPRMALVLSGSKDTSVKVWDPRQAACLRTLHAHNQDVTKVRWNDNGRWFLSASRDSSIKIWDIRTMSVFQTFKPDAAGVSDDRREVAAAAWHPYHERVLASGHADSAVRFWTVDLPDVQAEITAAHDKDVTDIAWHPLGHMLASVGNDTKACFWLIIFFVIIIAVVLVCYLLLLLLLSTIFYSQDSHAPWRRAA
jgi:polyadenylation factor subunit 2